MVSLHFSARRALAFLLLCIAVPVGALLITSCTFPWQHASTSASTNLGAKPTAQQATSKERSAKAAAKLARRSTTWATKSDAEGGLHV